MTSAHPPVVASWLLECFCPDPGLAGDLIEEYGRRQSPRWYWKQAVTAVAAYSRSQIVEHKWLALRAIITGYVIWYVFNVTLLKGYVLPWMAPDTTFEWAAYMLLMYVLWVANGWVIAKLHRPYSTGMVFAYMLWAIVYSVPIVFTRALDVVQGTSSGSVVAWEIVSRVATLLMVLAGGTLAAYRELKQSRTGAQGWHRGSPRAFAAR
ncbi:MAG TPA: hypothetical protein VLV86_15370 [Vicinamibacterales bacterium]|nr:hypothetical protein [Vicinamibacterales bacterium]